MLDRLLKEFVQKVKDNSEEMLEQLQSSIDKEQKETSSSKNVVEVLLQRIEDTKTEIKLLNRQRINDIKKHPEREDMFAEIYDEQIDDLTMQIEGFKKQIQIATDKHNAIIQMNRTAKTVIEVFDAIIKKKSLTKVDVDVIIDRIDVYKDHIDIRLKSDIDTLLRTGVPEELQVEQEVAAVNFNSGTKKSEILTPFARVRTSKGEILSVNIISEGDPLEIYTESNGEVIFKKYSPIGEMSGFAEQYAEVLSKVSKQAVLISDCDRIVAAAGIPKKEVLDKKISPMMEEYMSARKSFIAGKGAGSFCPIDNSDKYASIMYPIISAGDVSGAVVMLLNDRNAIPTETENKLIQAAAAFLGRQMEA